MAIDDVNICVVHGGKGAAVAEDAAQLMQPETLECFIERSLFALARALVELGVRVGADALVRLRPDAPAAIELLARAGADVRAGEDEPLMAAVRAGSEDAVAALLALGANARARGDTPIEIAAGLGHLAIVQLLHAKGADVQSNKSAPIYAAAENGHAHVLKYLFDNVYDCVTLRIMSAFCDAARNGHVDVVRLFIDEKLVFESDIDAALAAVSDPSGAGSPRCEIIRLLLAAVAGRL